jgi:hypothetical protein
MTGQEAAQLTKAFDAAVDVTGAILTKLDGDSRGGAALSVKAVSGKPIKFVGTGEKMDALEPFYPERLAGRVLGMGDVLTLVRPVSCLVPAAFFRVPLLVRACWRARRMCAQQAPQISLMTEVEVLARPFNRCAGRLDPLHGCT